MTEYDSIEVEAVIKLVGDYGDFEGYITLEVAENLVKDLQGAIAAFKVAG